MPTSICAEHDSWKDADTALNIIAWHKGFLFQMHQAFDEAKVTPAVLRKLHISKIVVHSSMSALCRWGKTHQEQSLKFTG
jgi:hypothetical protein